METPRKVIEFQAGTTTLFMPHTCAFCFKQTKCAYLYVPILGMQVQMWFCQDCSKLIIDTLSAQWNLKS